MSIFLGTKNPSSFYFGDKTINKILFKDNIIWEKDSLDTPLTFTAIEDSTITLNKNGTIDDVYLEYAIDNGEFQTYTFGTTINLTDGQNMLLRAVDINPHFSLNKYNFFEFEMTGKISASGNIQTLLDKTGQKMDVSEYCYIRLFRNCSALTQAPELPATTLDRYCYGEMFQGCTSLTEAPKLPATTLGKECYYNMFAYCNNLTQAPELPATTLAENCYECMFQQSGLTQAPELPATTLGKECYYNMFFYCQKLVGTPYISVTDINFYNCMQSMFNGTKITSFTVDMTECTSVPSLPSATLFSSSNKPYTILVPAALYDEWIQATNWSTITDKIQAV